MAKKRTRKLRVAFRKNRETGKQVPIGDLELIERLGDEIDIREAKKTLADATRRGTISCEAVQKELGL